MENSINDNCKPDFWNAKWLCLPHEDAGFTFYKIRKTFFIDGDISEGLLYITANLKYRLWVNGSYVGEGPLRSGFESYAYDNYDVSGLLNKGKNVIAVMVNHFKNPPSAFLCQLEYREANERKRVSTDQEWLVKEASEYHKNTMLFSFSDYSECYEFGKVEESWQEADFQEVGWSHATLLDKMNTGMANRVMPVALPFRKIVMRDVPDVVKTEVGPTKLFNVGEAPVWKQISDNYAEYMMGETWLPLNRCTVTGPECLLTDGEGACVVEVPSYSSDITKFDGLYHPFIVLDFGDLMNGYLQIEIESEGHATVDIGYADRIYHGRPVVHAYRELCQADRLILNADKGSWKGFHWHEFRYVQLSFRNLTGKVTIKKIHVEKCDYPFNAPGKFVSSESVLDRLWEMTEKTVRLCTFDNFMDNGLREKQPWTGDITAIILGAYAMFGDDPMIRRYMKTNMDGQKDNGLLPPHWPSISIKAHGFDSTGNILWFEHPMALLLRMSEYYVYGGHQTFVETFAGHIEKYLNFIERYENMDGVLENIPGKHWVDWAPVQLEGVVGITNIWYSEILAFASKLKGTGRENAGRWQKKSLVLKDYLKDHLWNPEKGLFADCIRDGKQGGYSEHTNYTALLYGLVEEKAIDDFVGQLLISDIVRVEPSFMYTPIMALMLNGHGKLAVDMIKKRYRIWFEEGYDTLPEEWHPNASYRDGYWIARIRALAQGASCGLPYAFLQGLLGVKAQEAGYRRFTVTPAVDVLDMCQGTVPAPVGAIEVSWNKGDEGIAVTVVNNGDGVGVFKCPRGYGIISEKTKKDEYSLDKGKKTFVLKPLALGSLNQGSWDY